MPELTVDGVRLVYDERGDGEPVVLVCGTGQARESWDMFARKTLDGAGYRTIAFDNRGIPPSDCPPPPYSVDEMAGDAIGVIEQVVGGPCRLLGGSLGAIIVREVALRRPDLVRAAALVVGGGDFSLAARMSMEVQAEVLRAQPPWLDQHMRLVMLDSLLPPVLKQDDEAVRFTVEMAEAVFGDWGSPGRLGQIEANLAWARESHLDALSAMQVPCVVVAAEHDTFFPPGNLRAAAERIPGCEYFELAGSAHVPAAPEHLEQLDKIVLDFFARH